jgi:hypothetical protein
MVFERFRVPHPDVPVYLTALLNDDPNGRDITLDDGCSLNLNPLVCQYGPLNLASDYGIAGENIALDDPAFGDQHLAFCPHGTDHEAFDLYDAIGGKLASDLGSRCNHRKSGLFTCGPRRAVTDYRD